MINKILALSPLLLLLFASCSSIDNLSKDSEPISKGEQKYIDSLMSQPQWEVPKGKTTYPEPHTWNLVHQNAEFRVDLSGKFVKGFTELFLVNQQTNNDSLVLDAGEMEIEAVRNQKGANLEFRKDSSVLVIYPDKAVRRLDTTKVAIKYQTGPSGSLQFINPLRRNGNTDSQVWTRSDMRGISGWLPTIARPDEKATVDLWISIPDFMETVASGRLIERKVWPDDTLRTDYWTVSDPVPISSIGWAAGEFTAHADTYKDKIFRYYSTSEHDLNIPLIYKNTGKVVDFLESISGTAFSSDAYHLVPLQRYPAMGEALFSTSFLFEEAQFDKRASQDVNNNNILLQLFGKQMLNNLLVYDDWIYAGLKEGLSRHFVYMFYKQEQSSPHKSHYLRNRDYKRYYNQADTLRKPLLFRSYGSPYEYMDAHGRYKSAAFWYMLQQRIGEEAFLNGLQTLLSNDKKSSEEPNLTRDNLIRVFGQVSGQSLQKFFKQWLDEPGHATVEVETSVVNDQLLINFEQLQKKPQPIYELKPEVEIITDHSRRSINPLIQTADTTIKYDLEGELQDVLVDPDKELLVEWRESISKTKALDRLKNERAMVRLNAIDHLSRFEWDDSTQKEIIDIASRDSFAPVRQSALKLLSNHSDSEIIDFATTRTYENESDGRVRITALHAAAKDTVAEVHNFLRSMIRDTSYFVAAEAIKLYARKYPDKAYPYIRDIGLNSSYRNVLKAGLAQGLRYIESEEARKDLYRLASETGYDQYISDAMESLAYHVRNSSNSDWRSKIIDLYVDKSNSPYPEIKNKAGKLLEDFQSRPESKDSPASTNNSSS